MPEGSRGDTCVQCDQEDDLLSLVAELEVEYQDVRDQWNCTLPSLGNAAYGSFARVRGILTLLPSGRRRGPERQG